MRKFIKALVFLCIVLFAVGCGQSETSYQFVESEIMTRSTNHELVDNTMSNIDADIGNIEERIIADEDFTAESIVNNDYTINIETNVVELSAKRLFIDVLQNDEEIYFDFGNVQDDARIMALSHYLNLFESPDHGYVFQVTQFSIVSLRGSDIPVVILEISPPYPGDRLILHYNDGRVCGYVRWFRTMKDIRADGSFSWSGGITNMGTSELLQGSSTLETAVTSEYVIEMDNKLDEYTIMYFVHGEQVSESMYDAFQEEHNKKNYARWHEFVADTISEDFEIAWYEFFESYLESNTVRD